MLNTQTTQHLQPPTQPLPLPVQINRQRVYLYWALLIGEVSRILFVLMNGDRDMFIAFDVRPIVVLLSFLSLGRLGYISSFFILRTKSPIDIAILIMSAFFVLLNLAGAYNFLAGTFVDALAVRIYLLEVILASLCIILTSSRLIAATLGKTM